MTPSSTALPTGPWPKNLTAVQIKEAEAAIAAYRGFYKLINAAFAAPEKDWSTEAAKWSANPVKANLLAALKGTAQLGQYRTGDITVNPKVTKVQVGLVTMSDCVDSTAMGFYDKNNKSIKAPNAPGSYFRHVSQVQVAEYVGKVWLVTFITDDYTKTC